MRLLIEERITPFDIIRQWAPRLIAATLFLFVGASKFSEHSEWVVIFTKISAEGAREAMKEFRRIAIPTGSCRSRDRLRYRAAG
jgi:hypothetical protein